MLGIWPPAQASPYRPAPEHTVQVKACTKCAGVWVDRETLQSLLEDAARSAPSGAKGVVRRKTMAPGQATRGVVYRRCPECGHSMLRKNFGSISGIVVDVCAKHGTFFDYGELPEVVEFVRSGGLELAERHAAAEDERDARHRSARAALQMQSPNMGPAWLEGDIYDRQTDELMHRVAVFVRNMFR